MSLSELIKNAISDAKRSDGTNHIQMNEINAIIDSCQRGNEQSNYEHAWFYISQELMANKRLNKRKKVLFITDQLVHESPTFRGFVGNNISLIAKSAGLMKSLPITVIQKDLAKDHDIEYEEYVKELICLWDILYGQRYPAIHMMKRYLEESLRLPMPDLMEKAKKLLREKEEKECAERRKVLLQAKKVIELELPDTISSVELSLYTLKECFAILFPQIGAVDVVTSASVSGNSGNSDDNTGMRIPTTLTHNPVIADKEAKEEEDEEDEDDWENVNWESAPQPTTASATAGISTNANTVPTASSSSSSSYRPTDLLYGSVPYTLKISLSAKLLAMQSTDNAVLVSTVREVATHLAKYHVPKLKTWKQQLLLAQSILSSSNSIGSGSGDRDGDGESESEGAAAESAVIEGRAAKRQKREEALRTIQLVKAVSDINRLLTAVAENLCGKCKRLLTTTSSTSNSASSSSQYRR